MTEKSNLKLGMQGQAVRLLKIKLQLIGFNIVVPQPLPITHVTTGISSSEVFDAALNDTVREFQKQQDLPMTGIVDLRTTTRLDQMVERSNKFAVLGTVAGADGKPLPNVIVKASDRDVGKNTELNKATTDTQGRYTIFYDRDQFSRAEKANADLVLAVNGHPDYKPDIIFNALPVEIVNLVPEGTEYKEPSEYQNLLSDLAPLLVNVAVPNAPQAGSLEKLVLVVHQSANRGVDPKKNDLIFMRQEMNALSEQFDALVAAINLSEALKNKFAVAFVYGLIRQNLPSELHQLLSTTKPELVSALVSAFSNNIIPFELKEQELKFIAFLQKLSVNHQIREATSKEKSSLVDLLRLSGVAKKAQNQYAKAVYENTGSEIDFFKTLVDDYGLTKKQVSRIEHTLTLGRLVDKHAPMVNALLDKVGNADKPNYAALAKLELKDWEQLIRDQGAVGFPVTTQGKNANEKRKNYAVKIKQTIERLYSTETIAHKLPGVVAKNDSNFKNDIQRFFERNTAFSFDQHTVVDYLKNEADTRGIQDVPRLQNTLAQTQRLIKVVGKNNRLDKLSPLLQAGYQSAAHIASQSQNTFFKRVSGSMPEPVALEVYSLSSSVSFISESLKTRIREWVNPAVPAAIPPAIDPDILSDLLGNGTNEGLSEIFGSLNRCACEHCQSAYSPAAYYVDLLHELKKTDEESGALTELFNRRPDLEFIQLSCANTNTVIPYIDLVNEVLESAIELGEYQNQTGATGKTQAELKARWEYQNDRVYSFVNRADLNWSPIFEPDFVQANALLDYFKIDTTNCLGVIGEPNIDGYTEALITLGVSSATADVFTTSTTNSHGLSHKLTEIMQQSGLEYDAVEQLLALTWLNPEGVIEIKFSPEESCDLDNATLIGIDKTSANKIWRFLRLNAALNWQIDDLGSALAVASDWAHQLEPDADNPDRVAFTHLASLYKLSKRTGYDLLDVAAWFSLATSADTEDVKSALALQRLNAIANAVNISVDEVNDIADLMGVDLAISSEAIGDNKPLSPSLAIEFLDSITLISELKIDVGQLRWVLKNKDQQPAVFEPKVETVDAFLTGLWDGGEKLREQLKELHESTEVGSEERLNEEDRLNRLTNEFIITQLTSYTSSTEAIISTLLEQYFADTDYSISALQTFVQAESLSLADSLFLGLKKLAKATAILDMFGLTHEVLSSSVFSTANLVLPEEEIIGFEHWLSFASLVKLNKQFLHWEVSLFKTVGEDRSKIESITGWPAAEVEAFVSEPALGIDLSTPEAYEKLSMLFALQKKLDATSADVIGFIEALKNQNYAALSTLLNSAGKRKLGESRWFEVITPINNVIREQKRDVLVNYLETEVLPGGVGKFSNASEIYAYYLIDPEMSSCRQTSRIKNAISAVQLYIQRIRMGLESVEFSKLGRAFDQEWDWRKNYRVWEANRKVFLYPENYIFPELRDDQTIFFKEFVSKLLQDELTENNIEYAVDQYLEQMDEVARLDIRAIYQDEEPDGDSELHILARTHGENPKYFYRKKNKNLFWLGWQPVDIDIKGDHHALVKHNGRLQLIWMTFEERGDGEEVTIRGRKSNKDSFLELHSSEYGLSGWIGSKKILEQIMPGWLVPDHPPFHEPVVISRTLLKTKVIDYKLHIAIYLYFNGDQEEIISFVYDECLKTLVSDESNFDEFKEILVTPQEFEESRIQYNLQYQDMKLVTDLNRVSGFIYPVSDFDGASESTRVTRYSKVIETSRHYSLLSSSQKIQFRSDLPFIFEDSFGAFIVRRTKQYRRSSISEIPYWPATFEFRPFYHPFACSLIKRLRQKGLPFLYGDFHSNRNLSPGYPTILGHQSELREGGLVVFEEEYGLEREVREPSLNHGLFDTETIPGFIVKGEIPEPDLADEKLDFSSVGAYSIYNWELFFHIPLHTAQLLTQAGKHEEAQIWLHRVFNPTDKSTGSTSNRNARVWRIAPFYKEALKAPASIEELLVLLRSETDETEDGLLDDISAWRSDPFNPHLLARMRISAYMRKTVLQYLDNLIQWGDYLFRRHTIESINEASNIYIMAYELLGPKPTIVSKNGSDKTSSFADFEFGVDEDGNPIADLDAFSNVFFEDLISDVESTSSGGDSDRLANTSIIKPLFFCIPGNSDLLKYWDIVADRLFKIRHCQDISGRSRSLPLFELPIDPALLVRARAAGLDINSVLDGLYGANRPTHRYPVLWQKALDLCNEVRSLGGALLSALEKKDAEQLANIRATHEVNLLDLQSDISDQRIEEANNQLAALRKSKDNAEKRKLTYSSRQFKNAQELQAESEQRDANHHEKGATVYTSKATVAGGFPQIHTQGISTGTSIGGQQASAVLRAFAEGFSIKARNKSRKASEMLTLGGYYRRQEDWDLQKDLADIDIDQIDKQILAAQIRIEILTKEKHNLQVQTDQSKQVGEFLRSKFTNQSLYTWMSNQLMTLYRQTYDLAVNLAMQAQSAANHELGEMETLPPLNSIVRHPWDNQYKGLLAGEKLALQLRRLDSEFLERNIRKFELTKSISLSRLNPEALFEFKENPDGCKFSIPTWLFDMDFPEHTNRRIKNVRLTIPAVTGPYTTLAVELTHDDTGETIATSNGQNDSGLFELNFRDDRFLPFEGESVESSWGLRFPGDEQFDRSTISDVIMHMSYTADPADTVPRTIAPKGTLFSVLSVKNQFPTEWALLQDSGSVNIEPNESHLPYGALSPSGMQVYKTKLSEPSGNSIEDISYTGSGPWQVTLVDEEAELLRDIHLFIEANLS